MAQTIEKDRRPYVSTVLQQFVAAISLERNPVVRQAVQRAFGEVSKYDGGSSFRLIADQNYRLSSDLVEALAEFLVAHGHKAQTPVPDELSATIEGETGFHRVAFEGLLLNYNDRYETSTETKFDKLLKRISARFSSPVNEKQQKHASAKLRTRAELMRANIGAWSGAPHLLSGNASARNLFLPGADLDADAGERPSGRVFTPIIYVPNLNAQFAAIGGDLSRAHLYDSDFRFASLSTLNLNDANLERTDLRGATFYNVDLERAKLGRAKLDGLTQIMSTEWWQADFTYEFTNGARSDDDVIAAFFQSWSDKWELKDKRSKTGVILDEAHSSVKLKLKELLDAYLS
jgi:hypothetical protein